MKKVGLFGGSFDPFHLGHLHLAIAIFEKANLDEVRFIPAQRNPFKESEVAPFEHRVGMLLAAIKQIPYFSVDLLENARATPSYSIDTLKLLKAREPDVHFYWILGEDTAAQFSSWHKPDEILQLADLLIGSRSGFPKLPKENFTSSQLKAIEKGWLQTPIFDVSATEIRERLQKGLFCGHLLPQEVVDYIAKHQLY